MNWKLIPILGIALGLCGCPKPQKYARPEMPVPSTWSQDAGGASSAPQASPVADMGWREFFTDSKLQTVIATALTNNRDLRVAALNVEKVQALYRIQSTAENPEVNAGAGGQLGRTPARMSMTRKPETTQRYSLSLGTAAWELDLFGRIRNLKSGALEQYLATEQARSATQISLVAAIAQSYLALAADRENLHLAQATLEAQLASCDLIRQSRDMGIATDLDVRESQTQVDTARVDIARYKGQIELDIHALNLLAGAVLDAGLLPENLGSVGVLADLAPGMSSEVLLTRPDILLAEHRLKAAYANIGVARAAFFPRIALTGSVGLVSGDLSDLFRVGSRTWSFVPQLTLPLFDSGARKANYQVAQTERDIAVAEYEKTIQSAFREVADALGLQSNLAEQLDAQQSLVRTLEETYRLSDARYKGGVDSYLRVLVAQRSLYAAQKGVVGVRLARMANLVTLYKVLGGGLRADRQGAPTAPSGPAVSAAGGAGRAGR